MDFKKLFFKYYTKTASDIERQQLFRWLADDANSSEVDKLLKELEQVDVKAIDGLQIERNSNVVLQRVLSHQPDSTGQRPVRRIGIWTVAASLLLCIGIYFFFQREVVDLKQSSNSLVTKDIPAGGNKAILTLADGKKIVLDSLPSGDLFHEGGIQIVKSQDGQITYRVSDVEQSSMAYNSIETPIGGFYQVILPDDTHVWLNAKSQLKFPTRFAGNERRVQLTGEAYFEVAKDKKKPFFVNVNATQVQVLGTHFNIDSYKPQTGIYTTVSEGTVAVSTKSQQQILHLGQQVVTGYDQRLTLNPNVDIDQVLAWKEGYFSTKSIKLQDLMEEIERWYGVEVSYTEPVQAEFAVKLPRNISLHELLSLIEMTDAVQFKLTNKTLFVMKPKT